MAVHIRFFGATGEVTGSRYLLEGRVSGHHRQILIDCGMFQGGRDADRKNLHPFGFSPKDIDCVVLTHAHIDHSGLLPRLCAQGFSGPIYCTPATLDLLEVLLADSAHIQAGERRRAEEKQAKGKWRGELPEPLYSIEDVEVCIGQCQPIAYAHSHELLAGVHVEFQDAGHILGASIAILDINDDEIDKANNPQRIVFSGDIGARGRPVMNDPQRVKHTDVLIVESTYGDRLHRTMQETEDELVEVVTHTLKAGGNIVMPAFAVGRTQEVIAIFLDLIRKKRLPFLSIFVDSPMATKASEITEQHTKILDPQTQELYRWAHANPHAVQIRYITEVNDSKALNQIKGGAVILSASGMCEAGRIVHHLFWNLPNQQSAVVITGFQAVGTLGRALVDGAKTVKLLGREVMVKASVHTLGGLSAHGDQQDLLWWCQGFASAPKKIFVTHGEPVAAANFARVLHQKLHWPEPTVPQTGELYPC